MISQAILAVLSVIETIIPMLTGSSSTVTLVTNIINALTQLMPFIIDEITTVYTAVKNIIDQLKNSGAPTPDQLAALTALDAQVDTAWAAVQSQIDPDAPGGDPAGANAT